MDLNTTNIVRNILIIPKEGMHKKLHLTVKKCWHCKNQFEFWKKNSEY